MTRRARRRLELALELTVPVVLIAVWWVWSGSSGSFYFPPLSNIVDTFADTWLFERVGSDVVPSLVRMALGWLIAVVLGVAGGTALGVWPALRHATSPIVEFLRSIPPPALIPFAIVAIGVGSSMKVFIIAFVGVWPILLATIDGIVGIDPLLKETARVFGIRRWSLLRSVYLPAASPQILAGLRLSLSLALILMVISEMVASTNGIGFFVLQSQRTFAIPEMWSGIILLGLLGYLLNLIFVLVERRILAWHRGARASALG